MKQRDWWSLFLALVLLIALAVVITVCLRPAPFRFVEKVVADLGPTPPEGTKRREIWRSPDGGTLAYKITRGWDALLMINGKESPPYDSIEAVVFSPDGGRITYVVKKDEKAFAVIDGVKGPEYWGVGNIQFSADGKHVMYKAMGQVGGALGHIIVLDGKVWREADYDHGFREPRLSADGQHVVWQITKRSGVGPGGICLVIDGAEGAVHDEIRMLKVTDAAWAVVQDGRKVSVIRAAWPQPGVSRLNEEQVRPVGELPEKHHLGQVYTSANREAAAFRQDVWVTGNKPAGTVFLCDGHASPMYKGVSLPAFSENGSHTAWIVKDKGWLWVVRDRDPGPSYGAIGRGDSGWTWTPPVFSPAGERLAYKASRRGQWFIVCDEKEGPPFTAVGNPMFSPDSAHLAYTATANNGTRVVLDGEKGAVYDAVEQMIFSPDSAHLAYAAKRSDQCFVVTGGMEGTACDEVAHLRFSPDSRHLLYAARRGGKWFMVVDGVEGPAHAKVWIDKRMKPDLWPEGAFRYLALDDGREALVELRWPKELDWQHALKPVVMPFKQRARDLLEDFSATEFAARERALEKLIAMGPDVLPMVKKTLAETDDFEVKRRCKWTLLGIVRKQMAASPAPARPDQTPAEAVPEVTKALMTAVADDDMETFAKLAVEDSPAWRMRSWPRIAREVRVLYAGHPERLTVPAEVEVEGDVAAVRLPPVGGEDSSYVALLLKNTPTGWRVCRMEERHSSHDLEKCLDEHQQREAAVKQFGAEVGKPIDGSFVFERGRYVEAPYVIERWGLEVYLNDIRLYRHSELERCAKNTEHYENMLQGGLVVTRHMGSTESGMSHKTGRQFLRLHIGDLAEEEKTAFLGRRSLREGWEITRRRMATGYEHSPQLLERWKKAMHLTLREAVDLDHRIHERKVAQAKISVDNP